jgi:hypothetical protein
VRSPVGIRGERSSLLVGDWSTGRAGTQSPFFVDLVASTDGVGPGVVPVLWLTDSANCARAAPNCAGTPLLLTVMSSRRLQRVQVLPT